MKMGVFAGLLMVGLASAAESAEKAVQEYKKSRSPKKK